jgi:hypothetical protein
MMRIMRHKFCKDCTVPEGEKLACFKDDTTGISSIAIEGERGCGITEADAKIQTKSL